MGLFLCCLLHGRLVETHLNNEYFLYTYKKQRIFLIYFTIFYISSIYKTLQSACNNPEPTLGQIHFYQKIFRSDKAYCIIISIFMFQNNRIQNQYQHKPNKCEQNKQYKQTKQIKIKYIDHQAIQQYQINLILMGHPHKPIQVCTHQQIIQIQIINIINIDLKNISMLEKYTQIKEGLNQIPEFRQGKQKFKQFKDTLPRYFKGLKLFRNIPDKMIFQTVLFLAILDKKHQKLKSNYTSATTQLINPITTHKQQIIRNSQCSAQQFNQFLIFLSQCTSFLDEFVKISQIQKEILYHSVLSVGNKQQSKFLFFRTENNYTQTQIKNIGRVFNETIYYMNYQKYGKKLTRQFESCSQESIYILQAKNKFVLLYPVPLINSQSRIGPISDSSTNISNKINHKDSMRVLQSGNLSASTVQKIFIKNNQQNDLRTSQQSSKTYLNSPNKTQLSPQLANGGQNNLGNSQVKNVGKSVVNSQIAQDPTLQNSRVSIGQNSILYSTKVKCSKCEKTISQFDCLHWNYTYYCYSCLVDIKTDTTDIPAPKINKFMKDRNIQPYVYTIPCPQCQNLAQINHYHPAFKNTSFRCNLCSKTICVQHNVNIYTCFCFCNDCKTPTVYLQNLKINFCQKCRNRYCFKCRTKGNRFCKCVCRQCLGEQSKTHQCQPACHSCNNKPTRLRQCRCGLQICYGCYYRALQECKEQKQFSCGEFQYI